jgi:hypothetical protein
MGYGSGAYGTWAYGVPPSYPVTSSMPRALRIRALLYLILIPTLVLLA